MTNLLVMSCATEGLSERHGVSTVRTLYRVYLYFVVLVLLFFAAGATAYFLATLFRAAGIVGPYGSGVYSVQTTQAVVLFIISWVVTLGLGGLHYLLLIAGRLVQVDRPEQFVVLDDSQER